MRSWDPARLGGIILALACGLGLAGCSAVKLGYNSLPELAWWWLDGHADFSHAQRAPVRAQLARLHAWHRQQELPRLADLLARLEQLAPGDISADQACAVVQQVHDRLDAVADQAQGDAAATALALTPRQLQHMERKFQDTNERFRQEQVAPPPAEQQDRRHARMLQRAEMVYGRLDDAQRALLRRGLAESGYDPARILADRQRRQQDLLRTLRGLAQAQPPSEQAQRALRDWLTRAQHAPDPAYRAWQEGLVAQGCRVFAALHQSTTPAQREHAARRLRGYQRDLRTLAAQPL